MTNPKSAGGRRGAPEKVGPISRESGPSQLMVTVYGRAFHLAREISRIERWRSGVAVKAGGYLRNVAMGKTNAVPQGVPNRIRDVVRRCFAQACLELEVTELPAQRADWYPAAESAAREHMK